MSGALFFDQIDPDGATSRKLSIKIADCLDELAPHPAITLSVLVAFICERLEQFTPELRIDLTRAILETVRERIRQGLT